MTMEEKEANIEELRRSDFELEKSDSQQPLSMEAAHQSLPTILDHRPRQTYPNYTKPTAEEVLIMDLDAYNYISAFLFEGMGTEEEDVQSLPLPDRQKIFKENFLANGRYSDILRTPELLPLPTLKRLSIAVALLAIEELSNIRREHTAESELDLAENYTRNKNMSSCYQKLVEFLVGDSLSMQEKAEGLVITMIVEFKSLHFLSDLAGGVYNDRQYQAYVTDQAKTNLTEIVSLSLYEKMGLSDEAVASLTEQLDMRRAEILRSIDMGEISLDSAISLASEQTLLKCLMSIAISANTEMLPVLHPGYHIHSSPRIRQSCIATVRQLRHSRKMAKNPVKIAKKKKRSTYADSPNVSDASSKVGNNYKIPRKRKIWTEEETQALEAGIKEFGNDWVAIQKRYATELRDRNPVALKDRARSMRRIFERANKDLGVWACGSKP